MLSARFLLLLSGVFGFFRLLLRQFVPYPVKESGNGLCESCGGLCPDLSLISNLELVYVNTTWS